MLTILQIAEELGVAESTVRYWRDRYSSYIPVRGNGRQRRYPPEALGAFRYIQEATKQNIDQDEIEANLVKITGKEIAESQTQRSAVESQKPANLENATAIIAKENNRGDSFAIEQMAAALTVIAEQRQQLAAHEEKFVRIEERQARIEESLERRDTALMAAIRELQQQRQEQVMKKPWWKFWKGE